MTGDEIIRLSSATNAVVVQLPERKHPGVVIQGDSLKNLASLLDEALHELDQQNVAQAHDIIAEFRELVQEYLEICTQAKSLASHN